MNDRPGNPAVARIKNGLGRIKARGRLALFALIVVCSTWLASNEMLTGEVIAVFMGIVGFYRETEEKKESE